MQNKLLGKTFIAMAIGLLVSFLAGIFVLNCEPMLNFLYNNSYGFLIVSIIEIILVIYLSARALKMDGTTAKICFLIYSFVSGLTFSSIFIAYQMNSIINAFMLTAVVFAVFGFIGYTTKIDLTKIGNFLCIALIICLIVSIINLFIGNSTADVILDAVIILIMVGFTAYDMQKLKQLAMFSDIPKDSISTIMALSLYLDFINIFLRILSLFGKRRD